MHQTRAIDFSVGLFILLGLSAMLFLVAQSLGAGSATHGDTFEVEARFDHIGSLRERAPVALRGVTIGQVTDIRIDPDDYQAVVRMRIDQSMADLPADSFASIASTSLLGGKYVEISPGGDTLLLRDEGEIVFTQSAIVIEDLVGKYLIGRDGG